MIGLIDYGMGNLLSVHHALEWLGAEVRICKHPEELHLLDRFVLPGVGAFRDCIKNLTDQGYIEALEEEVIVQGKPILGICLGMQAMARRSEEGGDYSGLGWFDADVVRLQPGDSALRVPQIGWNQVDYRPGSVFFNGLPQSADFYFVHSYYMKCASDNDVEATCNYDHIVTAAVHKDNIFATQFHPEKSQDYGLKVLENFLKWNP